MSTITQVLLLVLGFGLGGGIGFVYRNGQLKDEDIKKRKEQEKALQEANTKAADIMHKAKGEMIKLQEEARNEERIRRKKIEESEERLIRKEQLLDSKMDNSEKLKEKLESDIEEAKKKKEEAEKVFLKQEEKLKEIAQLNKEEAKQILFKQVEEESKDELIEYAKNSKRKSRMNLKARLRNPS